MPNGYRSVLASQGGGVVPEGATITPTDDVQIWLECAGIIDKSYTTLAEVFDDTETLLKVVVSHNADNYLVRSTTWASDICANELTMWLIGKSNYCSNLMLNDSTWFAAINNSAYIDFVMNISIPVMTSNTTPSGVASASSAASGHEAYRAFDRNASTNASPTATGITSGWIRYVFAKPIKVLKLLLQRGELGGGVKDFKLQYSIDNGTTWMDIYSDTNPNDRNVHSYLIDTDVVANDYRIYISNIYSSSGNHFNVSQIQLYGRA